MRAVAAVPGDSFRLVFNADDPDSVASVTLLADMDGNLATTGDQALLFSGVDGNGAQQSVTATVPLGTATGLYNLLLKADDGNNPPVVFPLPRPLLVYPGIAGVAPPRSNRLGVEGPFVVFSRGEAEDGAGPLNGDGFADDGVLVVIDSTQGMVTQPNPGPSMDVTSVAGGRVVPVKHGGGTLAWLTLESDENKSLNASNSQSPNAPVGGADMDQVDAMISYLQGGSPTPTTNTYGGTTAILDVVGGLVVAHIAEAGEGNPGGGTDRNLDGDVLDAFQAYLDPTVPAGPFEFNQLVFWSVPPLPTPGTAFKHKGVGIAAIQASEAGGPGPGGVDANGDGDANDTFLEAVDLLQPGGSGVPGNVIAMVGTQTTPAAPATPVDATAAFDVSMDGRVGYYIDESRINFAPGGVAGNDINGDGIVGFVPAFYDTTAGLQTIPAGGAGAVNAPPGSATMIYDGTRLFFVASEFPRVDPAPGTNGDGDGGGDLQILYWTDHSLPTPPPARPLAVAFGGGITLQALSLDGGGKVASLAPGWLAVVVNEASNGNQDINGSGVVDLAYLLVDTTTMPAPTVYNMGIVPSAAGTIPITGVAGFDPMSGNWGVVVRLTEAANGDLDADMNATETFLARITLTGTPTVYVLDSGGDHVQIAGGYIGVTAQESFTGRDYDGNGSSTDTVLRVYAFVGTVAESGLLCSTRSVAVTDNGLVWAYLRDEAVEGRDLNGDADQTDLVLGLWIP